MYIELVFYVMLLGHILGDFYFQSDKLAEEKDKSLRAVLKHCLYYTLCIVGIFFICIPFSCNSVLLVLSVSFAHVMVDSAKYVFLNKAAKLASLIQSPAYIWVKRNIFIIDQFFHFAFISICYWRWGQHEKVRWFISQDFNHLPYLPIIVFLGVLCILKPVSIYITSTSLWDYKKTVIDVSASKTTPLEERTNTALGQPGQDTTADDAASEIIAAGRIIGYLERLIIFFLLVYQEFGAIAFVLTAKSLARFKDMEDRNKAEYYLIGTLLSVVSVFAIAMLLGLCKAPQPKQP